MWRDRWFTFGVLGVGLLCVACLTPLAVLALALIGLGAWAGYLDWVLLPMLPVFAALAVYRAWLTPRGRACAPRTPRE